MRRVTPRTVLVGTTGVMPPVPAWIEAERRGEPGEVRGVVAAQLDEHRVDAEQDGEGGEGRGAADEALGVESAQHGERAMNIASESPEVTQRPGQLDPDAPGRRGTLEGGGLLDSKNVLLELGEGASAVGSETVRQRTDGAPGERAVPASDQATGRRDALVGSVTTKPAVPLRMPGTGRDRRAFPESAANVVLAG